VHSLETCAVYLCPKQNCYNVHNANFYSVPQWRSVTRSFMVVYRMLLDSEVVCTLRISTVDGTRNTAWLLHNACQRYRVHALAGSAPQSRRTSVVQMQGINTLYCGDRPGGASWPTRQFQSPAQNALARMTTVSCPLCRLTRCLSSPRRYHRLADLVADAQPAACLAMTCLASTGSLQSASYAGR
jgi:hypothetical protein